MKNKKNTSHASAVHTAARNSESTRTPRQTSISEDTTDRIRQALGDVVAQAGLYLESVSAMRAGGSRIIQVILDLPWGPGGVDSDTLTDVSRKISATLDDVDLVEGTYTLEVSTPGTDRPLSEPRHFSRAIGRLVAFTLSDDSHLTGRVESVTNDKVNIRYDNAAKTLSLSEISKAHVELELSKLAQ